MLELLIAIVLPTLIGGGAFLVFCKQASRAASSEFETLDIKLRAVESILNETLAPLDGPTYSKKQLAFIERKTQELHDTLASRRSEIGSVEQRLSSLQSSVDEKEKAHQSLKLAKEDDKTELERILAEAPGLSKEARELEKQLAQSLATLEPMSKDASLSPEILTATQKLLELSSLAADRLRELIIEERTMTEKINNLKTQQEELEIEYTKLVERQLG